jgi:hypothetical protein
VDPAGGVHLSVMVMRQVQSVRCTHCTSNLQLTGSWWLLLLLLLLLPCGVSVDRALLTSATSLF